MSSAWDGLVNTWEETELPHYAFSKVLPVDSYFTSNETAQRCLEIFESVVDEDLSQHTWIEPGAGHGSFLDVFPSEKKIGVDIVNRMPYVETADFLTWSPDKNKKHVTLGNPPFGVRGAIALAFLNRSLLWSDYVGFILPMSFLSNGKGTNMKRVQNGHLVFSKVLEKESFISPDNGKTVQVNTLFQVWKQGDGPSFFKEYDVSDIAEIYTVCSSPDRLCGLDKLEKYDFFVSSSYFGSSLKSVNTFDEVKYGSGYGVILKEKIIKEKLMSVEWNNHASLATNSCKHIRKYHIEKVIFDMGYGKEINGKI